MYANAKKYSFGQARIEYLSYIILGRVVADENKVVAMLKWPNLKSIKELRGSLGLTGYYRNFVEGYGKIVWPLTKQLKKNNFAWSLVVELAFQALKQEMTSVLVLALPYYSQPFCH